MQKKQIIQGTKVGIIGMGRVGSSLAFALMQSQVVSELTLVDRSFAKAEGEAWDLNHGMSFSAGMRIKEGNYKDLKDANFIVITAGAKQQEGETRLDLLQRNINILKDIFPKVLKHNKQAIFILVSNPVDVLTYAALKISGLPRNQVIGSGTTLDTSRFRFLLGHYFKVNPKNVHAYIIGEHGDSEVPVLSSATIAGVKLKNFKGYNKRKVDQLFRKTKNAAYEVISRKGATNWAIALAVTDIIRAIAGNKKLIMPVSTLLTGQYGIRNVALSLPTLLDAHGAGEIVLQDLDGVELWQLKNSAKVLKQAIRNAEL
ncbi:MAG: L-lactate dehydrogenase [Candidatus Gracilibacteria bacterium]|nr:L-lactate dehydrogenase [Candidatus Gracilibacteria bacterium]